MLLCNITLDPTTGMGELHLLPMLPMLQSVVIVVTVVVVVTVVIVVTLSLFSTCMDQTAEQKSGQQSPCAHGELSIRNGDLWEIAGLCQAVGQREE
jgi:hypothetical protein